VCTRKEYGRNLCRCTDNKNTSKKISISVARQQSLLRRRCFLLQLRRRGRRKRRRRDLKEICPCLSVAAQLGMLALQFALCVCCVRDKEGQRGIQTKDTSDESCLHGRDPTQGHTCWHQ
jgi:hypothetical protein